jgi:hypothetical protein
MTFLGKIIYGYWALLRMGLARSLFCPKVSNIEQRQPRESRISYFFVAGRTATVARKSTVAFNYQKPYARAVFDLGRGFSYRMTWNYCGYNGKGQASNAIPGLAAIPIPDFNGSTVEFALRYAF